MFRLVETEDIREYGLIPEFIGRLPIVFSLQAMDEELLVQVLQKPKNAILKQYRKLLQMDEVDLEFEDDAMMAVAKKAIEHIAEVLIIPDFNLLNLVRCTETVKEVKERNSALNC